MCLIYLFNETFKINAHSNLNCGCGLNVWLIVEEDLDHTYSLFWNTIQYWWPNLTSKNNTISLEFNKKGVQNSVIKQEKTSTSSGGVRE